MMCGCPPEGKLPKETLFRCVVTTLTVLRDGRKSFQSQKCVCYLLVSGTKWLLAVVFDWQYAHNLLRPTPHIE